MIYGLTAPFAAALMEEFGVRRVAAVSLVLVPRRPPYPDAEPVERESVPDVG